MGKDRVYKTSDLYAAAWLLSKGFQLQGIDRSNKQRDDFVFEDRPDRPELVHSFMTGPFTVGVNDCVEICPKVMHLVVIEECGECSYFEGEVKRQKQEPGIWHTSDTESIHSAWDWGQIPSPLRPLFRRAHWEEIWQPVAAEVEKSRAQHKC